MGDFWAPKPLLFPTAHPAFLLPDHRSLKYKLDGAGRLEGGQGNSEGWGLGGTRTQALKLHKGIYR